MSRSTRRIRCSIHIRCPVVLVVWDIMLYHLQGIDVILEMDWQDKNHGVISVIVCKDKRIYAQPRKKKMFFQGV